MIYEAVLLFGVLFAAELLFDLSTQNFGQAQLHYWRNLYLFVILGTYFTYFWRHGGQTLPMQTWHIKIVGDNLQPITLKQACIRYCVAWMWFLPALGLSYAFNIQRSTSFALLLVGVIAWAWSSRFTKNGQFLHDKLVGTQIISVGKKSRVSDTE